MLGRVFLEVDKAPFLAEPQRRQCGRAWIGRLAPLTRKVQPLGEAGRCILGCKEVEDALIGLAGLSRRLPRQVIGPAARMCFHMEDRRLR